MVAARAIFLVAPPIRGKCNSCLGISGLSIRSRCLAGNRWSRSVTPPRTSPNCPMAEHDADEWQAAMEALLLVAEQDGPPLFARIGIMRAINRHVERVRQALGEAEAQEGPMTTVWIYVDTRWLATPLI